MQDRHFLARYEVIKKDLSIFQVNKKAAKDFNSNPMSNNESPNTHYGKGRENNDSILNNL